MKRRIRKKSSSPARYKRKKRSQRVRFRRRYASSIFQKTIQKVWSFSKLLVFAFVISFVVISGWRFWNSSPLIRVEKIVVEGDIPTGLVGFLDIHPGQNMVMIPVGRLQKEGLERFSELSNLSISRQFDRTIRIRGRYRQPLAIWKGQGPSQGIDSLGFPFPLKAGMGLNDNVPTMVGPFTSENRKQVAQSLVLLKNETPEFYRRLKEVKTDKMEMLTVTLVDGILIYWGDMSPERVSLRGKRVEKILSRFEPTTKKASMRFVQDNRVILDSRWTQKPS